VAAAQEELADLDPRAAVLLELAAEMMDMGSGPWTLETRFEDGHLRSYRRAEGPLGRNSLDRFDPASS
jgi:hypothetical protein